MFPKATNQANPPSGGTKRFLNPSTRDFLSFFDVCKNVKLLTFSLKFFFIFINVIKYGYT